MMRRTASLSLLILAVAAAVAAQDKPDFSGRWALVSASTPGPAVASSLAIQQPITRTNALGAPMMPAFLELIVERTFADAARTGKSAIGLESVSGMIGGGFESRSSSHWQGNGLVITTSTGPRTGPRTEHQETWEFDPAGMLLITITDRASVSREPRSNTLIYRRN